MKDGESDRKARLRLYIWDQIRGQLFSNTMRSQETKVISPRLCHHRIHEARDPALARIRWRACSSSACREVAALKLLSAVPCADLQIDLIALKTLNGKLLCLDFCTTFELVVRCHVTVNECNICGILWKGGREPRATLSFPLSLGGVYRLTIIDSK